MGKKNSRREQKEAAAKRNRIILITVLSVLAVALVGALVFALLPAKKEKIVVPTANGTYTAADSSSDYVKLNVSFTDANGDKRTGDIVIQLRPDCAPITVANFKKLVSQGYYDGTEFFRIVKGFMIQGGENENKSAEYIQGEFSANGIDNPLKHVRGTISMARRGSDTDVPAYDSASSGFFIVDQTSERNTLSLDGNYASFGSVLFGIENVDLIAAQELVYSETYQETVYPKNPVIVNSITFVKPVE